jgi:hypothetical protein
MIPNNPLADYFRCPETLARVETTGELSADDGYFTFRDVVCYGRMAGGSPSAHVSDSLVEASERGRTDHSDAGLPFELSEVVTNLRHEQYKQNGYRFLDRLTNAPAAQHVYYCLRPMLRVGVRKHLQKIRLSGWERIEFPRWPVDTSVDALLRQTLGLAMRQHDVTRIPFVWFWPEGADCALMMTHDVEGAAGREFCDRLMDVDDQFGVKSAFQLIPEGQENTWRTLAERLRGRGFEVNLHDLNHDGYLFHNRTEFLARAKAINRYAREFQCDGFRSGAMYRRQQWYDAFEFSFDMSVPNVAHLEPQRGGCCTVMPYFVGRILELPLTTIQDYSLFHILGDYSISLWQQQVDAIRQQNGLITFLSHPDYLAAPDALSVYEHLLAYLRDLRARSTMWVALPAEINRWWRNRREMTLVADGESWRIAGPGAERARLAYAMLDGDVVRYVLA